MNTLYSVGEVLFVGIFILLILYGVLQWFLAMKYMLAIKKEFLPNIKPWSLKTGFNPLNAMIFTQWLTPKGKEYAKKSNMAFVKMIGVVVFVFAVKFIYGWIVKS